MKKMKFNLLAHGSSLIEVLVSLGILSTVLLACMAFAINGLQRCRSCLWETNAISDYSTFFERLQLFSNRLADNSQIFSGEIENFNQSLPHQRAVHHFLAPVSNHVPPAYDNRSLYNSRATHFEKAIQ